MDSKLTILIADDSEDDVILLKRALAAVGATNPLQVCSDGAETLAYLKGEGGYADRSKHPFPSVIFLDLKMPGKTGFDVLRWIREQSTLALVAALVFTSSRAERDIREAYALGANAYLVKPGKFEDLKQLLSSAISFWSWCEKPQVSFRTTLSAQLAAFFRLRREHDDHKATLNGQQLKFRVEMILLKKSFQRLGAELRKNQFLRKAAANFFPNTANQEDALD